jgi:phosphatidylglycerophosphate synthase
MLSNAGSPAIASPLFTDAPRLMTNVVATIEKRCLLWLARRMPPRINSDHLTALALVAMFMTGASYYAARVHPLALLAAVLWLAINWFGDSLDGTVARVRQQQRPRYGFYVDHVVDCFGVLFLIGGLALSDFMSPFVAMGMLIAYFMLSIEVYLATYCLKVFRMSFWGIGPTELRLILAAGTIALLSHPTVQILGRSYRLFDVGGVVAITCMAVTVVVSATRNARTLYLAEPLPAVTRPGRTAKAPPRG